MRTTVRIDDDLLRELKQRARRENTTLTKLLNIVLRRGIAAPADCKKRNRTYREKTYSMGPPLVDITKALALAAELEDQENIRRMGLGE
jgi:hypothetical protein